MSDATHGGPSRLFFDVWSRFYDLPWVQAAVYRPVHATVLAELHSQRPARVLDVGCGTGALAHRVASEVGADVYGCDFSFGMLEQASARTGAVRWLQGDALRVPFADATFDALLSTEAFHWFPDQDAALAEFRRVLKPGGKAIVALVNVRARGTSRLAHAISRAVGEPAQWPTRDELRQRVENAGLRVDAQRRVFRVGGVLLPTIVTVASRPR